eukprot:4997964-Alexandrium_andersonii.AAC.1
MSFARGAGPAGVRGRGVPPGLAARLRRAGRLLRRARPRRHRLRRQLPGRAPALFVATSAARRRRLPRRLPEALPR